MLHSNSHDTHRNLVEAIVGSYRKYPVMGPYTCAIMRDITDCRVMIGNWWAQHASCYNLVNAEHLRLLLHLLLWDVGIAGMLEGHGKGGEGGCMMQLDL